MATARLAMSYDREVMAFPGRPEDKYSAGCNFLIKENIAALTENATDVAHLLGYPIKKTTLLGRWVNWHNSSICRAPFSLKS